MSATSGSSRIGSRSRNRPAFTTTGFLRDSRSIAFAVNSWGRNHPACAITARRPNASGASVSLLRNSGKIVVEVMNAAPKRNEATSAMLTVRFQA